MLKKVLIISIIPSDFSKLLALAFYLKENSVEVEFYFDQRSHDLSDSIKLAEKYKFFSHYNLRRKRRYKREINQSYKFLNRTKLFRFIKGILSKHREIAKAKNSFRSILAKHEFSVVISPLNAASGNLPVYLSVATDMNIKTVCMPFAMGDTRTVQFEVKKSPQHLFNSFFGFFLKKKWKIHTEKGDYLALPAEIIIAYALSGISIKFPASYYGLFVDLLLLENEFMKLQAMEQKIAAEEVYVSGSIFDDELYQRVINRDRDYNRFCADFGLDARKDLILIALPPFVLDPEEDSNTYRKYDFLFLLNLFIPNQINFRDYNIIVSLHPRIVKRYLDQTGLTSNIKLTKEPVEPLIPLCELFISTYSSTMRTAVALGKPVLNYDLFGFQYESFKMEGIRNVLLKEEYDRALENWVIGNRKDFCRTGGNSKSLLGGRIDGNSSERILNKLKNLAEGN